MRPIDGVSPVRPEEEELCADVHVEARYETPIVILVVDQSGSMEKPFEGARSRWDVLRDSLLSMPQGLIADLQGKVSFGLALYTAEADENDIIVGECPRISAVPNALRNYDAIAAEYLKALPFDETPTGDSIRTVVDSLTNTPDSPTDPVVLVLATDGEPDSCEFPNTDREYGRKEALEATRQAFARGIRTFVISVGPEVAEEHLQAVANAGVGMETEAPFYVAGNERALQDALREVVGGVLSCEVLLNGAIDPEQACSGVVRVNGVEYPCNDPNGWTPVDALHLRLDGAACEAAKGGSGATIEAEFPCPVFLI
jgi:hypothetical protein